MEFIVPGAPRSANANPRSRRRWRDRVSQAARDQLRQAEEPASHDLSVLIIYFSWGETTLDVDNVAKALLDGLKGVLFEDDQQVSELLVRKTRLRVGLSLIGASTLLLDAVEQMSQTQSDFVYVRVDAARDHGNIP
jgi:endodeoxyribonuclease RusA